MIVQGNHSTRRYKKNASLRNIQIYRKNVRSVINIKNHIAQFQPCTNRLVNHSHRHTTKKPQTPYPLCRDNFNLFAVSNPLSVIHIVAGLKAFRARAEPCGIQSLKPTAYLIASMAWLNMPIGLFVACPSLPRIHE